MKPHRIENTVQSTFPSQGLTSTFVLPIAVESNNFFGFVLYEIHKAKVSRKRIKGCNAEMRKNISAPSLNIRKPSLATQRRAVTSYPFLHQILAELLPRGQSEGIYNLSIM